ncbi:MAG: beta-lactamase family protein, partial [Gemmatimonadetes bacterium]|nr:beta-lactamase family protein [Gemmatimonadota bacterium]
MTDLPRLHQLLQTAIDAGACRGAQVVISLRGQDLDLCLGEAAPGVPMTRGHLQPWLSAGKPLTAIAWAQLWEQGLVGLDEPIVTQLPGFGQRGKEAITYRHVLTHTGGFRCLVDVDGASADWDANLHRVCQARLERKWIPGQRAGYQTRGSWYVLGEVVQRLSGRPLAELIRERICGPAGMADSWLALTPQQFDAYGPRMAELYD